MIPPEAIHRFIGKQKELLRRTYDNGWQGGVDSYQPDADPDQEPTIPQALATAGLTGAALLAARRAYKYVAPTKPDPVRRAVALAPSYRSLNSMYGEIATISPEAAGAETTDTGMTALEVQAREQVFTAADAFANALQGWVDSNAYRLDAGDSVAWAGEQTGYAEAADTDGKLLEWDDTGDDHECEDCARLAEMPPQPLEDWPCQPGDGATECNVGCRCQFTASDRQVEPNDTYAPTLTGDQSATVDKLVTAQAQAMSDMMPDAQYLD